MSLIVSFLLILIFACLIFYYLFLKKPEGLNNLPATSLLHAIQVQISNIPQDEKIRILNMKDLHENKIQVAFRNGFWSVIVSSAEAARQIYNDTDTFQKLLHSEKRPNSLLSKFNGVNLVFSNHDVWKRHRKVLNPPFKKQFEISTFERTIRQFFEVVDSKFNNKNVEIYKYMQRITMDALGKGIMGVDFNSIVDDNVPFINVYNNVIKAAFQGFYLIFYQLDCPQNPFRKPDYDKLQWLEDHFQTILDEKKRQINGQVKSDISKTDEDILTLMLKASQEEGVKFTEKEIRDNVMIFLLAGHDTTAFALSGALHFLAQNPDIQEKARKEVMEVMGLSSYNNGNAYDAIFPTVEQTKHMEYLMAVMKETMRLYPSIGRLPQRICSKEVEMEGHWIPKDTVVVLDIYSMHHDPEYFEDPEKFIPERFIHDSEISKRNKIDPMTWTPFGGGTRSCIGMNFSLLEQKTVLSMILSRYHISYDKNKPQANGAPLCLSPSMLFTPDRFQLNFTLLD